MNWIKNLYHRIRLEIRYRKKLKELKDRSKVTLRRKSDLQIVESMNAKDGKEGPSSQIKIGN